MPRQSGRLGEIRCGFKHFNKRVISNAHSLQALKCRKLKSGNLDAMERVRESEREEAVVEASDESNSAQILVTFSIAVHFLISPLSLLLSDAGGVCLESESPRWKELRCKDDGQVYVQRCGDPDRFTFALDPRQLGGRPQVVFCQDIQL